MTKQITIGEDLDGFLGYDSTAIAMIDIEASKDNYENEVEKEILKIYPELEIYFAWNGQSNYGYLIYGNEEYDYLQDDLEEIENRVYNKGEFWKVKE